MRVWGKNWSCDAREEEAVECRRYERLKDPHFFHHKATALGGTAVI